MEQTPSLHPARIQRNARRHRALVRTALGAAAIVVLVVCAVALRAALKAQAASAARDRGLAAYADGAFGKALPDLSAAAASMRDDAELLAALADARLRTSKGDPKFIRHALQCFRAAIEAGAPRQAQLEGVLRGAVIGGLEAEALLVADELLAIEPLHVRALTVKAGLLTSRAKFDEARALLRGAIASQPSSLEFRVVLLECMRRSGGDPEQQLKQLDEWLTQADAPDGLRELRLSVELDMASASPSMRAQVEERVGRTLSNDVNVRSVDVARLRGVLLARVGRIAAARAVIDAGLTLAANDAALVAMAFALRVYEGECAEAGSVLGQFASMHAHAASQPSIDFALEALSEAASSALPSDDVCEFTSTLTARIQRDVVEAWTIEQTSSISRQVLLQLLDVASGCHELQLGNADVAAQLFLRAYRTSGSQWRAVGALTARAFREAGSLRESLVLSRELCERWPLDVECRAESLHARAAVTAALGSALEVDQVRMVEDARLLLADTGASDSSRLAALHALAICGVSAEFAAALEDARTRAIDPWQLARLQAIRQQRDALNDQAVTTLAVAAGDDRARIAEAAAFADRLHDARALELCRRAMPEGARALARLHCVLADQSLASDVYARLNSGDAPVDAAIFGLALAQKFPAVLSLETALAHAESARRNAGNTPRLFLAMADALASSAAPEYALAAELYQRAARLEPESPRALVAAARAASLASDRAQLAATAEAMLAGFSADPSIVRLAVGALSEAGEKQRAKEVAMRLARETETDEDVALAARALAVEGDYETALRLLDSALAGGGGFPACAQVRAALLASREAQTPQTHARNASVELREVAHATANDDVTALHAALRTLEATAISNELRAELIDLLRDAALRRGAASDTEIAAVAALDGPQSARALELARATFDPTAAGTDAAAARAFAIERVDDWCAWLAAIRSAQRGGDVRAAASAARAAFAALPTQPRLLRDGLDAILRDPLGDALGDAARVVDVMSKADAQSLETRRARALVALARGDGTSARAELEQIPSAQLDSELRVFRDQALLLGERFDEACKSDRLEALLAVSSMLSARMLESFIGTLERARPTEARVLASLRADLAYRAALHPFAFSLATAAARAAAREAPTTADPLATASAAMRAACAGGDRATISECRSTLLALLPSGVEGLLNPTAARSAGWEQSAPTLQRNIAAEIVAECARGELLHEHFAEAYELARHASMLAPASAEITELHAVSWALSQQAPQAAKLLEAGDSTVERLLARARVAALIGERTQAREHLRAARVQRSYRAFAARSLDEEIDQLAARINALP